jgi:hypothetical protein
VVAHVTTNTPWRSDHSESNPQQSAVHNITVTSAYALAALAPFVQGVPIAQSLMAALGGLVLGDAAAWTGAAAARLAKGLAWAEGSDPLVIDLDAPRARASGGCVRAAAGIETRDAWRAAPFILATVGRAANDDERACSVGNRRVEWGAESVWGIAA